MPFIAPPTGGTRLWRTICRACGVCLNMILKTITENVKIPDLVKRIYKKFMQDRCMGRAAELGFYFVLSIFPLLIFLLTLLSFLPDADKLLMNYMARMIPPQALELIDRWADNLRESRSGGLLSFGILFTLWSASTGMIALMRALNTAYEVKEGRPFLKARLVAVLLLFSLSFLILGGASLVFFGDFILSWIFGYVSLSDFQGIAAELVRYLIGLIMLYGGLNIIYNFGPNIAYKPTLINPGSIFATVACLIVSFLFSLYLQLVPTMNATYGSLGAFIVLMLWMYLISLVIMVGAEINSEIEKEEGLRQTEKE